jgi:hypothetical protein
MCYDDLDVEHMDWKELLELEGDDSARSTETLWTSSRVCYHRQRTSMVL